jgi:hypothetical protein
MTVQGFGQAGGGWGGGLRERDPLEDIGIDGRIILKCILEKWDGEAWIGLLWVRIGTEAGCHECGNEPLSSIKHGKFCD